MKATHVHYWLADTKGRLLDVDEGLGELLGYPQAAIRSLPVTELEIGLNLQHTSALQQRQALYRRSDGSLLSMDCCTRRISDNGGSFFTFLSQSRPAFDPHMLHLILESQPSCIVLFNLQSEVLWLNGSACRSCGKEFSWLLGKKCHEIWPGCNRKPCGACPVGQAISSKKIGQVKLSMPNNRRWRVTTIPIAGETGELQSVLYVGDDITEYLTMDKEVRQNHKLESLGVLAGGIAHDFNNILSGIVGYTELCLTVVDDQMPLKQYLLELSQAGKRATDLVRQILTFSRRGEGKLVSTPIPVIAREVLQLLRSTLPATIELKKKINSDVDPVLADPVHIHQIIMNLCTNASHAMEPYGGVMTVTIDRADLPRQFCGHDQEPAPGEYLRLSVSDTGCGMNQDMVASIFDPYFTTKPSGQGTGLGLSVVHGIVKDCGGHITVETAEGHGSTFSVYLPTVKWTTSSSTDQGEDNRLGGSETILVVDDEPVILEVTRTYLEIQGYKVRTESNSQLALNTFRDDPLSIDMLISDVTMPHLTGDRLAEGFLALRPDLPIILMTGYSDLVSEQSLRQLGVKALMMKPLIGQPLLARIRLLLDERKPVDQ